MLNRFKRVRVAPFRRRLLLIVSPFLTVVVLLVLLSDASLGLLSAVRAYVSGESLWSKGQKEAVFHLGRYVQTQDEADYQHYLSAISIPFGDHQARLELEKPDPDLEIARQGFLNGRNAPEDIPGLIRLFRCCQHYDGFAHAVAIWTEADGEAANLTALADHIHARIAAGAPDAVDVRSFLGQIREIDARLTPLEEAFSATLGTASRATQRTLEWVMSVAAIALVLIGLFLSRRMLRQNEAFEEALHLSEERYALALDAANHGIWDWDIVNRQIFYSKRVHDMLGYDEDDLGNDPAALERVILAEDYRAAQTALLAHWKQRDTSLLRYRMRMRTKSGKVLWILSRSTATYAPDGTALRMAGSYTDITEQVENEHRLRLAASVFEASHQGILIDNQERIIVSANSAYAELSGYSVDELIGMPSAALRSPTKGLEFYAKVWDDVETTGYWRGETLDRKKNGEDHPVELSIVKVPGDGAHANFYVLSFTDIAERQYAQARIHRLAFFDPLTGLPNRSYVNARFDALIRAARAAEQQLAVIFFDLDGLKEVNDTLGHTVGDALIVEHARRLRAGTSADDVLGRFGGDEFLLLLPNTDGRQAEALARTLIDRIGAPLRLEGRDLTVTASAGISVFPQDAADAQTLIREADSALYRAKGLGKNAVVRFNVDIDQAISRRFDLMTALRVALEQEQFALRFQPIMDTASGRISGAEALVYWNHPQQGTIDPNRFIALAEESGLIDAVGAWVIDEAFRHYAVWMARGIAPICLSINISSSQLRHPTALRNQILAAMERCAIEPALVVLEITERQIVGDPQMGHPVLNSLRALGVGLAIDDFGTGFSSLAYLKDLPVTQIKIDLSFIRNLVADSGNQAIVKAILDLGRSLQLSVIAEGVETEEQLAILREYGCADVQGYLFARPLLPDDFIEFALRHG